MKKGFTLVELLIYIGIFSLVMVAFTAMLVGVTNVQSRQASQNEVTSQSQFLLQQVQYYVQQSSLVEMPADTATTTLTLREANSSTDPTVVTIASGTVYLQQGGAPKVPLTSSRVAVSGLTFTKRSNAPSHDSVSMSFTVAYNTSGLVQAFSELFQTSIARVSAASFDSNLVPSSTATWDIGTSPGALWRSVNQTLYFSGSNVGIGVSSPAAVLEVNGGVRLNTVTAEPTCAAGIDGEFWVVRSGAGVKDSVVVCAKDAANAYAWRTIY